MALINGTPNDEYLPGGIDKDTINGLDGDDQLYGGGGNDVLNGGNDNDYLQGDLGKDKLNGGDGDDFSDSDAGDTINGGDGVDVARINLSAVGANLVATIDFRAGVINNLTGGTQFSNVEILQLTTGGGDDNLTFGANSIHAPDNDDHYWNAGDGEDTIHVDWSSVNYTVYGYNTNISVNDVSIALANVEHFDYRGGSGYDTLYGGGLEDSLRGNDGNDRLEAGQGDDLMEGGAGNDEIRAGAAADSSGADSADAGAGDDVVYAGYQDTARGGAGVDLLVLDLADRDPSVNFAFGASGVLANGTTYSDFERVWLYTGSGNDVLTIDSSAIFVTNEGSDQYWNANAGTDKVVLDFSDQSFGFNISLDGAYTGYFWFNTDNVEVLDVTAGDGWDTISGGSLNDTINAGGGYDYIVAGAGNDKVDCGDGRDFVYAQDGNDSVLGGGNRDDLRGEGGKDTLNGGDGKDSLYGGDADDRLLGGAGRDHLQGDAGKDFLQGGLDMDVYRYSVATDSTGRDFDTVDGFDFTVDRFYFSTSVQGYGGKINGGTLDNDGSFDNQLEAKIDAAVLAQLHAVLYQPSGGDFAGVLFLIVDRNNLAGYQDGEDYVIRLDNAVNVGSADVTDFQGPYQL
ncbi:MAG TPA: calcium-binding protein [Caulobacteraceae bacterium]